MNFIKYISILALVFVGCANNKNNTTVDKKTEKNKPNVIIVITDDQGYGDVAALGNPIIKTPNIDNFHKESVHFTDFHVGPTCAPTRSSLMTGRFANSTGVWHTIGGWSLLREGEKTLANMFAEGGYVTGGFGKWHMGDNHPFRPEHRGFQHTVMHGGGGVQQTPDYWDNDYFDDTYFKNGKPTKYKGYCTDVFFGEAINFIQNNKNKPFFCYIAPNAPHGPYNVPVEYYNMYKDLPKETLSDFQKRFYGMITNIDDNFGKLRKTLEDNHIADNTILIFMTDNGTAAGIDYKNKLSGYNAGMKGKKGSHYEGGHRVPFFIRWKNGNIYKSTDINELTSHIDVMPTLAELCGISLPKDHLALDGESLVPFFKNPNLTKDRMLVTDSQRVQNPKKWKQSSVMQNKWRLVNGKELYNVENDKGQKHNIAKKHPEKVAEMRAFYEKWWKQVSVDFDKQIYFKVGSPIENPITLTCHDTHADNGNHAWNQIYIRNGFVNKGYWSIDVQENAKYKISLRRYPIESNLEINAEIPGISLEQEPGLEKPIPVGKNLNYKSAIVKVGNNEAKTANVEANAKSTDFILNLKKGKTQLNAHFINNKGEKNVAYYVYIEKL